MQSVVGIHAVTSNILEVCRICEGPFITGVANLSSQDSGLFSGMVALPIGSSLHSSKKCVGSRVVGFPCNFEEVL